VARIGLSDILYFLGPLPLIRLGEFGEHGIKFRVIPSASRAGLERLRNTSISLSLGLIPSLSPHFIIIFDRSFFDQENRLLYKYFFLPLAVSSVSRGILPFEINPGTPTAP